MKANTLLLPLALVTGLWTSCSSGEPHPLPEAAPVSVEIYTPVKYDSTSITVSGRLSASNNAEISTRMMAFVEKVLVKPGDQVKAGQTLIVLNANELLAKKAQVLAQISTAEMAAQNAEKDYQRFLTLHTQESVSDKELENMKLNQMHTASQLQMARQGLKEIEAQLTYTNIKAPFSGTVTQKYIDAGSMAKPGMPLLMMEQRHEMEVTASIPENEITGVTIGDRVEVEVPALNRSLQGHINELSPSASLSGGQYAMKVSLDAKNEPQLLAGMFATIKLPRKLDAASSGHLFIDQNSLIEREQLRGVYIVNADNRAVLRWLRLGKTNGNLIEVLSGLKADERIILNAEGRLFNGRNIKIK